MASQGATEDVLAKLYALKWFLRNPWSLKFHEIPSVFALAPIPQRDPSIEPASWDYMQ